MDTLVKKRLFLVWLIFFIIPLVVFGSMHLEIPQFTFIPTKLYTMLFYGYFLYLPLYLIFMLRTYFLAKRSSGSVFQKNEEKKVALYIACGYLLWSLYPLYYANVCSGKFCGIEARVMTMSHFIFLNVSWNPEFEVIKDLVGIFSGWFAIYFIVIMFIRIRIKKTT